MTLLGRMFAGGILGMCVSIPVALCLGTQGGGFVAGLGAIVGALWGASQRMPRR